MKRKHVLLITCIYLFAASIAFATASYPIKPDLELTPGDLCQTPDQLRYPEKIRYCDRDVNSDEKWVVILNYMKKYNFTIDSTNRNDFKIDHFIPLCMGGANSIKNLWPQHKSVYVITDPLEVTLCQKLANGQITQAQAIEKMKQSKLNIDLTRKLILEDNTLD